MRGGFTLVEILVVIVIIGILASMVLIGVMAAIKSSKISNTQAEISTIKGVLESYYTRWGDYPPTSLASYGIKLPNDTNNGIESLVASLSSKSRGGVLYQPEADYLYGNTDNDSLPKNPTNSYFGDGVGEYPLNEYLDFFGRPLIYFHHDDYAKPPASTLKYVPLPGAEKVEVKIFKNATTKTYAMPDKFQLWSFGPDGKPDSQAMIPGW